MFSLLVSLFAPIVARYLARFVLGRGSGTPELQRIAEAIPRGGWGLLAAED